MIVSKSDKAAPSKAGELDPTQKTIQSYELSARDYAKEISPQPPEFRAAALRRLIESVSAAGVILEVGSGTGRDADYVESLGVAVRRTDATQAFIELQAEKSKQAALLNIVTDEFGGPYDGILAMCVLIHVRREQTDAVLRKVARALKPGGAFLVSVRDGTGEIAGSTFTVYWRRADFLARLVSAGFLVDWDAPDVDSDGDKWLTFLARTPH